MLLDCSKNWIYPALFHKGRQVFSANASLLVVYLGIGGSDKIETIARELLPSPTPPLHKEIRGSLRVAFLLRNFLFRNFSPIGLIL